MQDTVVENSLRHEPDEGNDRLDQARHAHEQAIVDPYSDKNENVVIRVLSKSDENMPPLRASRKRSSREHGEIVIPGASSSRTGGPTGP
ncbi:hypothetical protein [Gordonibacter massiliensis (ex Traore et al. 2017)]|uniref:Uncharacterized protein n=1 Tax=Gordonibacter massiliensis (ex Traore et al. 2017) TaxID=1841863 RepID=A0A842JGZ6_9ACTN|nr:hypothetical protein [Gordonibacter massiliensis (ex Traore et al. 2017)]MBC2890694.1 hypothetical protein [Gordonibacter massiliensis (ex Traore et al. 2017)]